VAGVWVLSRRPIVTIQDSPGFVRALALWHPLIYARRSTPRSMKRFLNRVRYYAMRQRPLEPERTFRDAVLARLGWPAASASAALAAGGDVVIPEAQLVAFSALEHVFPEGLETGAVFKTPEDFLRHVTLTDAQRDGFLTEIKALQVERYVDTFRRLSRGIRI
jgi:hypothetical protein